MPPAAIRATFSDFRPVKSRKVVQLVFEIPVEQAEEALSILGFPQPDKELWCGIARLQPAGEAPEPKPKDDTRSERGREAYAAKDGDEKAMTRAALLCRDVRFQNWLRRHCAHLDLFCDTAASAEEAATGLLRAVIEVSSRSEITSDPAACQRFLALETQYKLETHQMAEMR